MDPEIMDSPMRAAVVEDYRAEWHAFAAQLSKGVDPLSLTTEAVFHHWQVFIGWKLTRQINGLRHDLAFFRKDGGQ